MKQTIIILATTALCSCVGNKGQIVTKWYNKENTCTYWYYENSCKSESFEDSCNLYKVGDYIKGIQDGKN